MFILGNVCPQGREVPYPALVSGGYQPWMEGYLPWMGEAVPHPWTMGTHPGWGVPTLNGGTYLGWGVPTLDWGNMEVPQGTPNPELGVPHIRFDRGNPPSVGLDVGTLSRETQKQRKYILATRRAVCLLRSCRKTFLFIYLFIHPYQDK